MSDGTYLGGLFAEGSVEPVTAAEVYEVFKQNAHRIKAVVLDLCRRIPLDLDSPLHHALDHAKVIP